ncbi:MAG: hypothetical protein FWF92_09895 [Oscillospiraceae bacterium]|nr:hypothetical protein [Oscillospiraceae bacterium]
MKKAIKIISVILILSMVFITLSCGSNSSDSNGGNPTSDIANSGDVSSGDGTQDDEPAAEIEIPFPHETINLGGAIFKILIDKQWSGNSLDIEDYDIEEMNGEVLNDAIYQRNLIIEETYNLKFEGIHADDSVEAAMNKTIKAGMDEYDAVAPRLMKAAVFAAKGYGINMYDTYLSLDAPWWDQNILKDTSIGGAAYFISGDIFIKHYDGIALLMFNKKLLTDLGLESPYILVNENKWTMDKFNEMVKGVYLDLDQDGKHNRYDRYGFVTQVDYLPSFVNGSGELFITKDKDDLPVFTGNSEKISNILDKMLDAYVPDTYDMHRDAYGKENGSGQLVQFWVFPEGRSLFYWAFPRYMDLGLRDMEDDFGIVPIPKWDSNQSRYYATVNNWHSYTYMLPVTVGDVERNSIILDAMAYHGRKIIRPAYYDVCLQRKYTRDEDSAAMLDIIFSSTVYDIATVYTIGGFVDALCDNIQKGQINLTSIYEKQVGKIDKEIDKLIQNFEDAKN